MKVQEQVVVITQNTAFFQLLNSIVISPSAYLIYFYLLLFYLFTFARREHLEVIRNWAKKILFFCPPPPPPQLIIEAYIYLRTTVMLTPRVCITATVMLTTSKIITGSLIISNFLGNSLKKKKFKFP